MSCYPFPCDIHESSNTCKKCHVTYTDDELQKPTVGMAKGAIASYALHRTREIMELVNHRQLRDSPATLHASINEIVLEAMNVAKDLS